ncbi:MAG: HNH endonuclease [Micromonosporaceae bacterium]
MDFDTQVRAAMFEHLTSLSARHPDGSIPSAEINTFQVAGRAMPLVVQSGIWKPAVLDAALTIRTTYTAPSAIPPYQDEVTAEGYIRYKYRGADPQHSDNRALRKAMREHAPVTYFYGVERGVYQALHPCYVVDEDAAAHEFLVSLEHVPLRDMPPQSADRRYAQRLALWRLHQPGFRRRVLRAYQSSCGMCRLRHAALLDAAHILEDLHPLGQPVVANGISLCKIHHAAYDANILSVRPDLTIEVADAVLAEVDGPMLRHGLQELHGGRLLVPRARSDQPDRDRLHERYRRFREAAA